MTEPRRLIKRPPSLGVLGAGVAARPGLDVTPTMFVYTTAIVPPSVGDLPAQDLGDGWWLLVPDGGD